MFKAPAKAISRNAIVIALGFMPLLLAPLVPYRTVGFFLAMIMLVSWLTTLFLLPALVRLCTVTIQVQQLATWFNLRVFRPRSTIKGGTDAAQLRAT
jgi:predicted exporter